MMSNKEKIISLFVPGRLCLFGEHSDWAGMNRTMNSSIIPGHAIVTGTEQGIYASACKAEQFSVTCSVPQFNGEDFHCDMDAEKLRSAAHEGGYFSYVAGVASYLCEWYHVSGIQIDITAMDLPMKKGLSSSAAICVLVAKAFNELYDLHLSTLGIMNIAYLGEQRTPSRCGRLDQACAYGSRPVSMIFDGNELSVSPISVGGTFYYVFADLMAGKDTVRILADLNREYPFPRTAAGSALHAALGSDNERIASEAIHYIETGDAVSLGALMKQAQMLFDEKVAPMSPEELASPVLHSVLNDEVIQSLTFGGKGVGSQGDGTVQFLARDAVSQQSLIRYLESSLHMPAYPLTVRANKVIRKAIIPVAGFGTRLYPETRFIKKEFCPVIDIDGLVKPALLVLLEELDNIGIEQICLILNPEEKQLYEDLLLTPLSEKHYSKLSEPMKRYEDKLRRIVRKITFAFQDTPSGFGHAVYQAADFAGDDPVLLLLGDTIYSSRTSIPCTKQLIDAFELYGQPIVAVQQVPISEVGSYGVFSGVWENASETIFKCTRISEKPTVDYAREYLSMQSASAGKVCYGAFGSYVLTPAVFDRLRYAVENNIVNAKNEVELTDALSYVSENSSLLAFIPDGNSFDLGNAEAYRYTVSNFGIADEKKIE